MDNRVIWVPERRGPSQLIEVPVASNGLGKVPFPDIQQLRSDVDQTIVIKAMRLLTADVAVGGILQAGGNAPLAELQKITVVLYAEGWEKGENIAILTMNDVATPGGTFPHTYHQMRFDDWRKVDWTKSFLQYANGTQSANAPYVVLFDVEYVKLNAQNQEIKGPS